MFEAKTLSCFFVSISTDQFALHIYISAYWSLAWSNACWIVVPGVLYLTEATPRSRHTMTSPRSNGKFLDDLWKTLGTQRDWKIYWRNFQVTLLNLVGWRESCFTAALRSQLKIYLYIRSFFEYLKAPGVSLFQGAYSIFNVLVIDYFRSNCKIEFFRSSLWKEYSSLVIIYLSSSG